jgi:hypothetical protein
VKEPYFLFKKDGGPPTKRTAEKIEEVENSISKNEFYKG